MSISGYDVQVVMMPYNSGYIHESVVLNEDNSFTIFLNDNLSPKAKRDAFKHAMWHITNNDFYSEKSISEIEYIAHRRKNG